MNNVTRDIKAARRTFLTTQIGVLNHNGNIIKNVSFSSTVLPGNEYHIETENLIKRVLKILMNLK